MITLIINRGRKINSHDEGVHEGVIYSQKWNECVLRFVDQNDTEHIFLFSCWIESPLYMI